jgi:hypothetical protein
LFQQTFNVSFEALAAGRQAYVQAEVRGQTKGVDDATPSAFAPGKPLAEVVWQPDEAGRDFLGNEFLLWLWYVLEEETDTLKLMDDSEVTAMIARTLQLECPRGMTGKESITSDGPARLPEARRAVQAGKWPRKAGLILVRHDHQYELTLQAEKLAISGAKLPQLENLEERARREERVTQVRHLLETLDLLYDAFGKRRLGNHWPKELGKMQKWLQREEPSRFSASG